MAKSIRTNRYFIWLKSEQMMKSEQGIMTIMHQSEEEIITKSLNGDEL